MDISFKYNGKSFNLYKAINKVITKRSLLFLLFLSSLIIWQCKTNYFTGIFDSGLEEVKQEETLKEENNKVSFYHKEVDSVDIAYEDSFVKSGSDLYDNEDLLLGGIGSKETERDSKYGLTGIEVGWTEGGILVCDRDRENMIRGDHQVVSDGSGGVIISWHDGEDIFNGNIYTEKIDSEGVIQWGENADGLTVCDTAVMQTLVSSVSDGSGGVILAWVDERGGIYTDRVDSDGDPAQFGDDNGIQVTNSADVSYIPATVSDGSGGIIIIWSDSEEVFAQRIDNDGNRLWGANGVDVCVDTCTGYNPVAVADGAGGAIIMWIYEDWMGGTVDIYAQKIDSNGDRDWGEEGAAITVCSAPEDRATYYKSVVSDGSGGAYLVWEDYRSGNSDVYAQRLNDTGAVQWTANGMAVCGESGSQTNVYSVADGSGGIIIAWSDSRGDDADIYAQSLDSSGDEQWTSGGLEICGVATDQTLNSIVDNGQGKFALAWIDRRNGGEEFSDVYAQVINSSGEAEEDTDLQIYDGDGGSIGMAGGDSGEVTLAWTRVIDEGQYYIYAQQILAGGSANGEACSDDGDCDSGFCTDGYCCESECDGTCRSCDQAGHLGECYLHIDNTDPDNECSSTWSSCQSQCVRSGGDGYCDGAGSCDINDATDQIDSGYVCTGSGSQTAVSAVSYCNYSEDCDSGDCSAMKWYTSCNGSGVCRSSSDQTDSYLENIYAQEGYTLVDNCGTNGTSYCGYSSYSCFSSSIRSRTHNKCSNDHSCSYAVDTEYDYCDFGTRCSNGSCLASSVDLAGSENELPDITIIEPDGEDDLSVDSFQILWQDSDEDNNASISLYYDSNNSGEDGSLIVSNISEDSDDDFYQWDISALRVGFYYVYGVIDDGENDEVIRYSSGYVTKILPGCEAINSDNDEANNDSDCDGIPDRWEDTYKLFKFDPTDASEDPDGDELNNLNEYKNGTDPHRSDTDGDGKGDGWEISHKYDPLNSSDILEDTELPDTGIKEGGLSNALKIVLTIIVAILFIGIITVILILKRNTKVR